MYFANSKHSKRSRCARRAGQVNRGVVKYRGGCKKKPSGQITTYDVLAHARGEKKRPFVTRDDVTVGEFERPTERRRARTTSTRAVRRVGTGGGSSGRSQTPLRADLVGTLLPRRLAGCRRSSVIRTPCQGRCPRGMLRHYRLT